MSDNKAVLRDASARGLEVLDVEAWNGPLVGEVLKGAARVILALPMDSRDMPARLRAGWPAVVRDATESYGYEVARESRVRPSGREIDQAMAVMVWLTWINDQRTHRIVVGRIFGASWRRLSLKDGRTESWLQRGVWTPVREAMAARLENEKISTKDFTECMNFDK